MAMKSDFFRKLVKDKTCAGNISVGW